MNKNLTLSSYVKRRNGVPLGAAGALGNMFKRSLGAASFDKFWQYWNPVWGYYLGRYVFYPLSLRLPQALALLLTFTVSGMLHDLAVILLKWQFVCFFTPWFTLMGIVVVVSKKDFPSIRVHSRLAPVTNITNRSQTVHGHGYCPSEHRLGHS